jgi:hypothetical protein
MGTTTDSQNQHAIIVFPPSYNIVLMTLHVTKRYTPPLAVSKKPKTSIHADSSFNFCTMSITL